MNLSLQMKERKTTAANRPPNSHLDTQLNNFDFLGEVSSKVEFYATHRESIIEITSNSIVYSILTLN